MDYGPWLLGPASTCIKLGLDLIICDMNLVCTKIHDIKLREKKYKQKQKLYGIWICLYCSKYSKPKQKIIVSVKWKTPQPLWHKLNTDGSALGCPGLAGGGGLLWDHHGKWIKGFRRAIGWANSLHAELWAVRDGPSLCIQLNIPEIEIELDTKSVVDLLNSNIVPYAPGWWL